MPSQERSVVERFFGRLKLYWGIMRGPCRSDRSSLDLPTKICIALASLKTRNGPSFAGTPKGVILRDPDCLAPSASESSPTSDGFDGFPTPKKADRQPVKPPPKKRAVEGSPKRNGEKKETECLSCLSTSCPYIKGEDMFPPEYRSGRSSMHMLVSSL